MATSFEQTESEVAEARIQLTKIFREDFLDFFGDSAVAKTLGAIESGAIGREGLKTFLTQQIIATKAFLSLFEILVAQKQFPELQAAAASNLCDETGIDVDGNYHAELAHSTWRKNFYQQIGIAEEQIDRAEPTPGTKAYFDAVAELVSEGDIGKSPAHYYSSKESFLVNSTPLRREETRCSEKNASTQMATAQPNAKRSRRPVYT